jgi:predicted nucleic acid-binding protein
MRKLFHEYFPLEKKAIDQLWSEAIVIMDTNVLLRLYRFKNETTEEVLNVISKLGDRIWIPYQVAWEYNERRLAKITESEKISQEILDIFRHCFEKAALKLEDQKNFGIHPIIDIEAKIKQLIDTIKTNHEKLVDADKSSSATAHYAALHFKIGDLFNGKVGNEFSEEELEKIYIEGATRYEKKIPPGFKDSNKTNGDRSVYGDLIIWKQIIDYSKKHNKPTIFVTEDTKDDWWQSEQGKTIGPAPLLKKEFFDETGQNIHFYRLEKFLELAATELHVKVSKESVAEVNAEAKNRENAITTLLQSIRKEKEPRD